MRIFLSAGREQQDPPSLYSAQAFLERMGHEVFVQSPRGGRFALARDLDWISRRAEGIAFLHGLEAGALGTYAGSHRKTAENYGLLVMVLPEREMIACIADEQL